MKRKTIQRQLILNITIPVVLVLLVYSFINYSYNQNQLEQLNKERLIQIQSEVQNLVSIYDIGMRTNEVHYESKMEELSRQFVEIFSDSLDPRTTNLYEFWSNMGLDTSTSSIYFIDTNGVIINTTFPPDQNLDFYARGEGYREYFEKIWAKNDFVTDRFSEEQATGRIRKWSFIPTKDSLYLIELGFLSKEARQLKDTMLATIENIANKHEDIHKVYLAMQVKGEAFDGIADSAVQREMHEVLSTKKSKRLTSETDSLTIYEDLIYIDPMLNETTMFSGMVLYIRSDDSNERTLISESIFRFVWMVLAALILLLLFIILRARTITRPIVTLTRKAEIISSGKLNERIVPEGNNEITQLSESFNHMLEQLQESYETLEQKVIDRTAEVVEQKNIAEHQRHLVEEKNKEILDSITYAKRIQQAILPSDKLVQAYLPNAFVLYKPKDIVAGDFYWMHPEIKDSNGTNWLLIASADCTGHGVPGALVSVVCNNALNRAVREFKLSDPGLILDKTRELVIAEFEKSDQEVKDGMDISLCAIAFDLNILKWSGANNPAWIVRRDLNSGELTLNELKPDKQPIGKFAEEAPFTTHTYNLQTGDAIYIFTDGYADQFGGEKGKKFKSASLKEFLLSIQDKPMTEQGHLLNNAFENWRGAIEQIDDVSIIGIRI